MRICSAPRHETQMQRCPCRELLHDCTTARPQCKEHPEQVTRTNRRFSNALARADAHLQCPASRNTNAEVPMP